AVNDTYGHRVGSRVLAGVGALLREELPDATLLARFGGDEFVAIIDGTAAEGVAAAERVRARLTAHRFVAPGPLDVGVSIGVAAWPEDGVDGGLVMERADAAMYVAKGAGRDQVVAFSATDQGQAPLSDQSKSS
ncbi:MAG: GGDEF domain-containing protein, partial [Myxococcales bacterium]|nr:GGDEF domain-containing protein [Myxococcales bacterium]